VEPCIATGMNYRMNSAMEEDQSFLFFHAEIFAIELCNAP